MKDKKSKYKDHEKPHYYGKMDGVHVYHGTNPSHKKLVGTHIQDPSDSDFKKAVKDSKKSGLNAVVIHGAPPPDLRSSIHPDLGPVMKAEIYEDLQSLRNKIRELLGDTDLSTEFNETHPAFNESDEDEADESREFSSAGKEKREEMVFDELNELEEQVKAVYQEVRRPKEQKRVLSAKEIIPGMLNPETHCDACDNISEKCVCFAGLPRPRVEFDGKKVTLFFKSDVWSEESQEAFIEDFKFRAGRLLRRKF